MQTAATAPTPPRIVPTVTQSVRVSWADWIEQILVHETPLIEAAATVGIEIGLGYVPIIGPAAAKLVAPTLVKQVVDQGLSLLEGMLEKQTPISITSPNWLQSFTVTTINQVAPHFAKAIGAALDPLVASAIAKATPAHRDDPATSAPDPAPPADSGQFSRGR